MALLARRREAPCLDGGELLTREGRFPIPQSANDVEVRLEALDRDEIDVALVSLQPTLGIGELPAGEREELENTWVEGMRQLVADSRGRLLAMGPGRVDEACVGAAVAARTLDDLDGIAPILDELERRGQPLFVHPGPATARPAMPDWWTWVVDYTGQMQVAYYLWLAGGRARWPELRVVFAILAGGAPFHLERLSQGGPAVRSTLDANVYLDVATYGRRSIELCAQTFGVRHLVYGSDRPVVDPAATMQAVRGFGESVTKLVCMDNPSELLP